MKKTIYLYKKDFTGFIRDRKHFILTVLGPFFLYPLLFICLGYFTHIENTREKESVYTVGLCESFPIESTLLDSLKMNPRIEIQPVVDSLFFNMDILLFVRQTGIQNKIVIHYRGADIKSRSALQYIKALMETFKGHRIRRYWIDYHLDERILDPFTIITENCSSDKRMGGYILGLMIPYMLFVICFSSAITVACDITAGEKERRTLETLLVTGISKNEIVMGKTLTTFAVALLSGISGFTGLVLSFITGFSVLNLESATSAVSVPWRSCAEMFLLMLPFQWFCASLLIAAGSYARNLKEAQTYSYYLFFLAIIPGVLSLSRMTAPDPVQYWIPVLNTILIQQQVLAGEADPVRFLSIIGFNLFCAMIMSYLSRKMFNCESVLFRS